MRVDLNADVGEGFDDDIIQVVTSVNIACGFHAGDPQTMRRTVATAVARGVAIGAHPGYADRAGFGRRALDLPPAQLADDITYQVGALDAFVRAAGARLRHVKLHGALYNTAARSPAVADAAIGAIAQVGSELIVVGPPGSQLQQAAARHGLAFAAEAFADRSYTPDGQLTPRDRPDALISDAQEAALRVVRLLREGTVLATDGTVLALRADTVCVHGDHPAALDFARRLADALDAAGITRQAMATPPRSVV